MDNGHGTKLEPQPLDIKINNLPYNITRQEIDKTLFIKKGKIASNVQEAHIMFDTKLSSIFQSLTNVVQICSHIENVIRSSHYESLKTSLRIDARTCKAIEVKMKDRQEELYNIFRRKDQSNVREKRFVGFLAGFLIGTIGMYSVQQLTGMRDSFRLAKNQDKIFTIIQDHEARITKMEQQIHDLNDSLAQVYVYTKRVLDDLEMEGRIGKLMTIVQMEFFNHDEITAAILDLLNGQINPTLLKTDTIRSSIGKLRAKARRRDLVIPLQRMEEIYQLPNSYIYENGEITIFIHVPMVEVKSMILYQLEPLILKVTEEHSGLIDETNYLAITEDETAFKVLTPEELDSCTKLNPHHYYCIHNVLLREFESYCISAIFKTKMETASKICDLKVIPQKGWAKQLTLDTFLVYLQEESYIKIKCGDIEYTEKVSGVNKLHIPECVARTNEFELFGQKVEEVRNVQKYLTLGWDMKELKGNLGDEFIDDVMKTMKTSYPVHVTDLRKKFHLQTLDHWYWHIPAYVILTGIVGFLIIAFYYIYKQERQYQEKKKNKNKDIQMNTRRQEAEA